MNLDGYLAKRNTPIVMFLMAILCNLVLKTVSLDVAWLEILVSIVLAGFIYALAIYISNRMRESMGLEESRSESSLRLIFWIGACLAYAVVAIGEFGLLLSLAVLVAAFVLFDLLVFKVFKMQ